MSLPDVTLLRLWVVDPKPFFCRARRNDERYVEHRLAVATVAHKHRIVVTLKEAFARPVDSLLTVLVIESHRTRLDRSRTDPGMMVPAGRASGFNDNLCNGKVCRVSLALYLDTVVVCFELPKRCSGY